MRQLSLLKVIICAFSFGGGLYAYLEQQNDMTKLRAKLPQIAREVHYLEEEVTRLQYEIERFENPGHLLELAKRPEFSHLKYPMIDEILVLEKESSKGSEIVEPALDAKSSRSSHFYLGAK